MLHSLFLFEERKIMKEKFNEITPNIKKNFELVQKCDEILTDLSDRGFILTLRQLFYQLLSKGLIDRKSVV